MIMDIIFIINNLLEYYGNENIENIIKIKFKKGLPYEPFLQLLLLLSSDNHVLLPNAYGKLMTEETSPVKEFYS